MDLEENRICNHCMKELKYRLGWLWAWVGAAPFFDRGFANRKLTRICLRPLRYRDRMRLEAMQLKAIPWITDSLCYHSDQGQGYFDHTAKIWWCVEGDRIPFTAPMELIVVINLSQITGQNAPVWCGRTRALQYPRRGARAPACRSIQCVCLMNNVMCRI